MTETRRLSEDVRRLVGVFAIAFVITVPPAQAAALTAKVEAALTAPNTFNKDFAAVFKAELLSAGVSQSTVDNLSVSSLTATPTYAVSTTRGDTTAIPTASTTTVYEDFEEVSGATKVALEIGMMLALFIFVFGNQVDI